MPVCRCPEPDCRRLIAWRGKALAFNCPGEHDRARPPRIHVDRHLARPNGEELDVHLPDHRGGQTADVERGRELVATNLGKAG